MTEQAIRVLLAEAEGHEVVPAGLALKLARAYERAGQPVKAVRWAVTVVDAGEDFPSWNAAAMIVRRGGAGALPDAVRSLKLAVLGSYNTSQFTALLPLTAAHERIALETYECEYGQYRQEVVDPSSGLYSFEPDAVVIAVHDGDLALPPYSDAPDRDVEDELSRWVGLWRLLKERTSAIIVQHNIAQPPESPFGHLGARLPGSRLAMTRTLNQRLGLAAGGGVTVVDCDWLSSIHGKDRWFDPRYWHLAKQAVSLTAVPALARHTIAVLGAELGLTRKCVVLDLDNTLWGGVIGEDGLAGIHLGEGAQGEAFTAFQEYLLRLRDRGILLAVASKNNEADAREPFDSHPGMRIRLDDIAAFVASWDPKPDQLRRIAAMLNIGTDALVFVDDNPIEREAMRRLLPEVSVVQLPEDPADYIRAMSNCLNLEPASFTDEDSDRHAQYLARREVASLEATAGSLDEFLASLRMEAAVGPLDELSLPRIAQLVNKTNQFNLTTRRHSQPVLEGFTRDPACVHFSLRLRDRLADQGLVALLIGFAREGVLDIDTWLMSCRVIGRTVEQQMVAELAARASRLGCRELRGTYIPTPKNEMVRDLYGRCGFDLVAEEAGGTTVWSYDLARGLPEPSPFIHAAEVRA